MTTASHPDTRARAGRPTGGVRRIAHVLVPARVGGLESVVRMLAVGQRARGDDVTVIAIEPAPDATHPMLLSLESAGVPLVRIAAPGRAYRRERAEVVAALRRLAPHVVHTHGYRADVLHGTSARALGIATVTTMHGFVANGARDRFYQWLQLRAARRFDAVIAVSRPLRELLRARGVPERALHLIPNAWAASAEPLGREAARAALGLAADRATLRLGWVGRIGREKGLDVAIRALADLAGRGLDVALSVIGDGAERAPAEALAESLGVARRITWHGVVPDAGRLLAAFDLFVLSSRSEGTPIAVFEAMAARIPIVATSVGGVPDVLGDAALLVPAEAPDRLADAIAALAGDAPRRAALAAAARARLDTNFAPDRWLERHEALYDSLVHSPRTLPAE